MTEFYLLWRVLAQVAGCLLLKGNFTPLNTKMAN